MAVDRYRILADPTRRRVLAAVAAAGNEGATAGELSASLALGRSLVSYHLARLQAGALVVVRADPADGRLRRYVARVGRPDTGRTPTARARIVRQQSTQQALPPSRAREAAGLPVPRTLRAPPAAPLARAAQVRGQRPPSAPSGGSAAQLFDPALRRQLAPYLHRRTVATGEALFWQGEPASGIWLVESGAIRVYTADAEGREQTLQIVRSGESLNEVPFFDRQPEPATALVVEAGVLQLLPIERRDEVLREVPALAAAAAASFATRLRQTVALVEDLRFHQVAGRVARVLLQRVEPHPGVGAGSGARTLTQREIAEMAGTSREVVARALRELEQRRLIRIERGRIVLLDAEGLADQA